MKINNLIYTKHHAQDEGYTIHMLTSSVLSFLTNGYLIETDKAVVAVDTFMIVSDAMALRKLMNTINKPLIAIIITHGHPDHYNGNSVILEGLGDVPVFSTLGVTECIRDSIDSKEVKWKPFFGDEWPVEKILPNHWVRDNETLTLDGLDYNFRDLGAAESNSDLYFTLGQSRSVVFVGDVVFNQMHGFMNDGHSSRWLTVLALLSVELGNVDTLFTGHGEPGKPTDLIASQIDYITTYRFQVTALANGSKQLTGGQKTHLKQSLIQAYPNHRLESFIPTGADSVAAEIVDEQVQFNK